MEFEKKNLIEIYKMSLEELNHYYRMLRKYEYENNVKLDSSVVKKVIHPITMLTLRLDRLMTGRKYVLYDDKRGNYHKIKDGKIYAASHVGRYDIETTMEAINDQAYFVMGDPEETYRNFEGFFLSKMHGRICTDTGYQEFKNMQKLKNGEYVSDEDKKLIDEYKEDRHICEENCIKRIKKHDNILIYPEGAWNITPKLTQPLFTGSARIAVKGEGVIIPIGIVRDDKKYTVNIGKPMNTKGATLSDVQDITDELKENINSLKGEIIFNDKKPALKRADLGTPEENERAFIDDIMRETTNGYTEEVIENSRFYDKNAPENVYKTLEKVKNKTLY